MGNWMILIALFGFIFGGSMVWGIVETILKHRRKMAELQHKQGGESRLLTAQNTELKETIAHMQDRLAVLEAIAIDPARRTADEIEKLR